MMNRIYLFMGLAGFIMQCRSTTTSQANTVGINQEFKLALNQQVTLRDNNRTGKNTNLGKIKMVQLEDSRCPAHTTCIRQGAAITALEILTPADARVVRLFIGDMMPQDSRNKRNLTADTLLINGLEYKLTAR